VYSLPVYLSLLPIVAGCSLSAMKEVSLTMAGLSGAMLSNVGMVLRNIYSKKSMNNYVIDGINLYALPPPPLSRTVRESPRAWGLR
jgi:solute carrier family 35 protein E1